MMKVKAYSILVLFVAAVFLTSCSSSDDKSTADKGSSSKATPVSPAFTIADIDGDSHSFSEYVGVSPVVLNFWGTWCPPCKREIPDLIRIYNEYKPKGLEIVGIAVNDTPSRVKKFAAEYGIEWVLLMANRDAVLNYKIGAGIPVTIFIDKDGNETGRFIGFRTYDDFKAQVEKII